VFRGSDVKELSMVEAPKENQPPAMPNDPAIMGVSAYKSFRPVGFKKYIGWCSVCKCDVEM
jgi:hypothetical protein